MIRVLLILIFFLHFCHFNCQALNSSPYVATDGATPRYDLSVRILPEAHRLEGVGSVLIAPVDRPRETVKFKLSDQMANFSVEVLEPAESAGATTLEKDEVKSGSVMWTVKPSHPFPSSKPVRLQFAWSGGEKIAFVFYIGPEGSFAGGLNTAWYPQVDGGSGTGRLQMSVPNGYTAHAIGRNRSSPEEIARGVFTFDANWPTYFGFVAGKYTVVKKAGVVPISAYLLRPRQNIDKYINGCSRILEVLVREFGAYPFSDFAIVEVPDKQASLAGFTGASVDSFIMANSTSLDEDFNLAYYGHEIGHQWWGNLIKKKGTYGSYMLDEAMAQYGSLRAVEIIDGNVAAEQYRRKGYPGYIAAQNGFGYLLRAAAGIDHTLADLPAGADSHLLSDSKGFFVLDMLSRTVGREKFRLILQNFTRQHAFQAVTWEEFLRAIEAGAGRELRWFFKQWFERTGAPEWQLAWRQEGRSVRIIITQPQPYYEADVDVRVQGVDQKDFVRTVKVVGSRTEFTWPTNLLVQSVVLDPHFLILWWTPEYRAEALALVPYTKASRTLSEGKYAQAHEEFKSALRTVPLPDLYGLQFMLEYGRGMVFYNEKKWADARLHFMAALASPSRRAELLPRLYFRLAQVCKELQDEDALRWAVNSTITADSLDSSKSGMTRQSLQILQELCCKD